MAGTMKSPCFHHVETDARVLKECRTQTFTFRDKGDFKVHTLGYILPHMCSGINKEVASPSCSSELSSASCGQVGA